MNDYKLFIISGMNEIDLKKQTKKRIEVKVYFNQDIQKLLNGKSQRWDNN